MGILEEHGFDDAYGDLDGYIEEYNSIFHSRSFSDASKIFPLFFSHPF